MPKIIIQLNCCSSNKATFQIRSNMAILLQLAISLCENGTHNTAWIWKQFLMPAMSLAVKQIRQRQRVYVTAQNQGWKRWFFKVLVFFMVFKKPKNLERSDFLVFLDIVVFCINYMLKPYSYYFFIIMLFSIYMNLYFTVFTLHSLCQYIVVFLGYFWLSRLCLLYTSPSPRD